MTDAARSLTAVEEVLRSAGLVEGRHGPEDVSLRGVSQDSRTITTGDLFLAWAGTGVDAHDHVGDAAVSGAAAAIVERRVDVDLPQIVVRDGRSAAALAAHAVLGFPSHRLRAVGVTGTNGKTTTSALVRHLLGGTSRCAVVGTLGVVDDGGVRPGTEGLTTPGPVQLARWLRDLVDDGIETVVVEASSHALEQRRLDAVRFDVAVFTNLSQDHLDYHGDMASYGAAKARLVELVRRDGTLVVNADDPAWSMLEPAGRRVTTFGIDAVADLTGSSLELGALGSRFTLGWDGSAYTIRLPLVGRYNVENALAAAGAARAMGVPDDRVVERLGSAPQVDGRLEAVVTEPFTVLIDFAHTPAALAGSLAAVKPLTKGRLIVLFGAGGDRDPTKRAPMAEAVRSLADVVVLTSDNPRTEDPDDIIDDVAAGLGDMTYHRFADRRLAIREALRLARPGDTVVLAGKGHETYQVVGTEKRPFDERRIVLDALEATP